VVQDRQQEEVAGPAVRTEDSAVPDGIGEPPQSRRGGACVLFAYVGSPRREVSDALHDAVQAAIGFGAHLAVERIETGDDEAYWRALRQAWLGCLEAEEDLVVVEQDIRVARYALCDLIRCSAHWCAAPYPYFVGLYAGLGCAKFGAALIGRHPDLWDAVGTMSNPRHPQKHWCTLDAWAQQVLQNRGERVHRDHHPPAEHLSDGWPTHGCLDR
jgi:hypothetical protein